MALSSPVAAVSPWTGAKEPGCKARVRVTLARQSTTQQKALHCLISLASRPKNTCFVWQLTAEKSCLIIDCARAASGEQSLQA